MKNDRNGIVVLMVLINLTIAGHYLVEKIEIKPRGDLTHMVKVFEEWEKEKMDESESLKLFYFNPNSVSAKQLDSLNLPQFIKNNIFRYREAGGEFNRATDLQKIYGMNDSIFDEIKPWLLLPEKEQTNVKKEVMSGNNLSEGNFDPNSASADELAQFGFNEFQSSNVEKYRAKGGQFHVPEDVMKIYGVDSAFFLSVKEHIKINETNEENSQKDILVELNSADSLELVNLRGIGPVFAARIIKYRNLLGGFASLNQLLEVYGFPEETFNQLKKNFVVDTVGVKKVRLNFAEYADLIRHPYLKRNHVEAILKYRDKHGAFSSEQELQANGLIDSVTYLRIKPYITCR